MDDLIKREDVIEAIKKWFEVINLNPDILIDSIMSIKSMDRLSWIPCSDRLPEEPFGCLVTVWDNEPMTGTMFENLLPYFVGWDGEQWNDGDGTQCPFEIIAWMPLPKPYKENEDEVN